MSQSIGGNTTSSIFRSDKAFISGLVPCNVIAEEILTDHPDRYRAMLVESGNPAHSLADGPRMREAIEALDFVVVIDAASRKPTGRITIPNLAEGLAVSPDGALLAYDAMVDPEVALYDVAPMPVILAEVTNEPLFRDILEQEIEDARWFSRHSAAALMPIAFFSDLPLSGQLNLMTIEMVGTGS